MSGVNRSGLVHLVLGFLSSRATAHWVGIFAILTLIWFAGRFIGLEDQNHRLMVMGAVFGLFCLTLLVRWLWVKRSGDKLAKEIANNHAGTEAEVEEIKAKMEEALSALKASHLGAGYRGNAALYALPWYMIIGPSAAGKSTLFANSGLHFPYSKSNQLHIQGFGGTRNCDWWFSDQAVLIDTAGRYTTEESDNDQWLSFLKLLRKYRSKQPINGVMVAISVADILTSDSEQIRDHVKQIRARIDELINQLGLIFPVYVVFTKCDLISGFEPFFNELSEDERKQPWGAYLLEEDGTNTGEVASENFSKHLTGLYERLCDQRLVKMTRERNAQRKQLIYDFPNQFKAASAKVEEFIDTLFKENPYQEVPWFAGVYFTSGTQEGTPIERSATSKLSTFRSVLFEYRQESITSAFFINQVFKDVLFKLQDLTRGNRKKRRVQKWLKGFAVCLCVTSVFALAGLLGNSYTHNQQLLTTSDKLTTAVVNTRVENQPLAEQFNSTLSLFAHYQELIGYEKKLPWYFLLGVYSADNTIKPIEQVLRQRVQALIGEPSSELVQQALFESHQNWIALLSTEEQVAKRIEPKLRDKYYQALKLQLMMSNEFERLNKDYAKSELLDYTADRLELTLNEDTQALTEQLSGLIDFYLAQLAVEPAPQQLAIWQSNDFLVNQARSDLMSAPEPTALYEQIKAKVTVSKAALTLDQMMQQNNKTFLQSKISIPYVYTKEAWENEVYDAIKVSASKAFSGDWVMGTENSESQGSVDEAKASALVKSIRALYFRDYANVWFEFLNSVEISPFNTSNAASLTLAQLSSPEGPLVDLMASIDDNVNLIDSPSKVIETEKLADQANALLAKSKNNKVKDAKIETAARKRVPELSSRFADLRRYTAKGEDNARSDYLEQYLGALSAFHSDIKTIAASNNDDYMAMSFTQTLLNGDSKNHALQSAWVVVESQVRALDPDTKQALEKLLKAPLLASVQTVMNEAKVQLNERWSNQVFLTYKENIRGKYPFNTSGPDAAVEDISELLNQESGVFWQFMAENLSPYLRLKRGEWVEKTWNGIGIGFKPGVLDKLTKARKVTRSLFPRDGSEVGISFQMMPVAQKGLKETYIGFSDQNYRYRNEPEEWRRFNWPARSGTEKAVVYGLDSEGRRIEIEKSGPWAFLKVLNEANVQWVRGTEFMATWQLQREAEDTAEPIQVQVALKSSRNSGIFSKYFMTSFALPESLFDTKVSVASNENLVLR
ncbi:type VI secretion system membrane subunit TssM [Pseudoalteromonas galatheae]|uniref:type VI secretion system membrane subunit TssM n=1 Tax=Pseudoalteromonas galatheae TaxID=579562 RepID=UPI0030D4E0FE